MTDSGLDGVDSALLTALAQNARASLSELAAQTHLSTSATRSRLMRLEERGVITGYTSTISPTAAGFALHAVVRMKVHGSLFDQVAAVVEEERQITRCLRITGESCYSIEVVARDMSDLERITSRLARVGSITTDLVYQVVADRGVPVQPSHPINPP